MNERPTFERQTAFGIITIKVLEPTRLYFEAHAHRMSTEPGAFVVNGVDYHCTCSMEKRDGVWVPWNDNNPYMSRLGVFGSAAASTASAERKVREEFARIAAKLEEEEPEAFLEAGRLDLGEQIERLQAKRAEKAAELAAIESQLTAAGKALEAL